ncbi:MAG: hemolysin family protein [Acidobacteriota bacterium]
MEPHVLLYLILAFLLVAGNAFFVAAEFAFVKVRHTRIEEMASSGLPGSALAREVVGSLDEYLSACQLGITLVSLGLGWVGEAAFAGLLRPLLSELGGYAAPAAHTIAAAGAFMIISVMHIVLGELVPKSIAIRKPGQLARLAALPLRMFKQVFFPALWLLNSSANGVLAIIGMRRMEEPALSEGELRILFRDSIRKGVITASEAEIMDRATRFADRTARDIMVALKDVIVWSLDRSLEENLDRARRYKHTRYPVYDPRLDDVIGVINLKALALMSEKEAERMTVSDVIKDLMRVPHDRRIDAVLKEMRRSRMHMAAVVDSDDRPIGVLTMEDIIEEIFGEIEDEFDVAQPGDPEPR